MEGYSEATSSYAPLDMLDNSSADSTVPAFSKVSLPSKMLLVGHLDRERPLSEPRWVKTGDVQEWLKSMFGRMFWVAGDAAGGWEKKIEVVDPDPVSKPSIPTHHALTILAGSYHLDRTRGVGAKLKRRPPSRAPTVPTHAHD